MADVVSRDLPTTRYCATPEVYTQQLAEQPGFAAARVAMDTAVREVVARGIFPGRSGVTHIPVVVHVVWHDDDENISDEQIQSQVDVLNQDFRKTNSDVSTLPKGFQALADDAQVEF